MAETQVPTEAPGSDTRKRKPKTEANDFVDKMKYREAGWLLYALILFVLNYTIARIIPGPASWFTVAQVAGLGLVYLTLNLWLFWTQINAIVVATDDQTPFDDRQTSKDAGWTDYVFNIHYLMFGIAVLGGAVWLLAPEWPSYIRENMLLAWPTIINAPFAYALVKIDRGSIASLMQRIISLKMRNTRFETPQH